MGRTAEGIKRAREAKREYEKRNPEVVAARKRAWFRDNPQYLKSRYKENRPTYMLQTAKMRAKAAGLAFGITATDIVIPDRCPVLGIPILFDVTGKTFNPNSPSLDRIVPALGYVRGNVRVISNRANILKRDATADELAKVAAYVATETARVERELAG